MLKKFDIYIIRKFLGTFFLAIVLIISIAVVFDLSEKLDSFMENEAPLKEIVFNYYFNFIPYFANLFSPLFTFIACIFFTSKMAERSEIIAAFASGISFHRMLRPYMISAGLIAVITFLLGGYVIPHANAERLDFEELYVKKRKKEQITKVQVEVTPGQILYIDYFDRRCSTGYRVSIDEFDGKTLSSRTICDYAVWDSLDNWTLQNYTRRTFDGLYESIERGNEMKSKMDIQPEDFFIYAAMNELMDNNELAYYINKQRRRGFGNIKSFEVEYEKRFAFPFASFILTLIGVSLSSKKVKGGMGINLGVGLVLSFTYIMFYTVSSTFTINGNLSPFLAVWIPNLTFLAIGLVLYAKAQK